MVYRPDGKSTELSKTLQKFDQQAAEKKIAAYRFPFTPDQRGDYTFVLTTPPVLLEQGARFLQDRVKVVLHVQTQKGWDIATGKGFELVPLTRPMAWSLALCFSVRHCLLGSSYRAHSWKLSTTTRLRPRCCRPMNRSLAR